MMKMTKKFLNSLHGRVMRAAFGMTINGPMGAYRVELQDDNLWSVEEILYSSTELTGTQYVAAFSDQRTAVTYARIRAGLEPGLEDSAMFDKVDTLPKIDRRGAIEHTRAKLC